MKKLASLRASGLVEVLVVMAIIGTTLVSSMLLVSQGFIEVRNNQTEDTINGLIVQTINKIKNSNALNISLSEFNAITTSTERNFYISNSDVLKLDSSEFPSTPMVTCSSNSVYNVIKNEILQTTLDLDLCIQISIKKLQANSSNRFSGSINYAYTFNGQTIASKLSYSKYSEFTISTGGAAPAPGGTTVSPGGTTISPGTTSGDQF